MRLSRPLAAFVVSLAALGTGLRAQQARPAARPAFDPNDLPPISYVCNSPGEENVMDDKPGACPKSGAPLVKVRIDIAYKCLRGPKVIQEKPGVCSYDKSELGPVTVSVFWSCKSSPEHFLEPGTCADRSAREKNFEERPHGDHNPRHGGLSVYMSKDLWHHVEGTLVANGVYRVYFYNEFTKPVPPGVFSASVAIANSNNVATGPPIPLTAAKTKDGNAMEAAIPKLPPPTKDAPVYLKLHVKFKPADEDWITDYQFSEYSKEPVAPAAPARLTTAKPPQAAKPTSRKPSAPAPPPVAPDPSGAVFNEQEPLPDTALELLALLKTKSEEVQTGVDDGQLGGVWLPALRGKDVGIALEENHISELADSQRPELTSAVKQLTVTAWQIDAAGDLGNKDKLLSLSKIFSTAVADIQALYAPAR